MPTENEIIDSALQASLGSVVFDLASFAEPQEIGEGLVRVSVQLGNSTEDKSIIVDKDITKLVEGVVSLYPYAIDEEVMDSLIGEHGICYIEDDQWYLASHSQVVHCDHNEQWIFKDDSIWGQIGNGSEGFFHQDEDYVRCQDSDIAYINSDVADDDECYYCNDCDAYRASESDHDCNDDDDYHCEDDDVYFNNTVSSTSLDSLAKKKLWGTDSPTFSISNGMRYTFGVEIETSRGTMDRDDWQELNISSMYDGSTSGPEYVTGVLKGDYGFNHLKRVCKAVRSNNHETNSRCGIHVHVGGQFNRRFTIMLLRLSYQLQDEIFRMMPPSRIGNTYCKYIPTWASKINFQDFREQLGKFIYNDSTTLDKYHNKEQRHDKYAGTRYRWVNINNFSTASGRPTVEFRNHGASMSYEKIRNWTLICMSIVRYAESNQKRIYNDVESITLKDVLIDGLGTNIASQVYAYYEDRVEGFKHHYARGGDKDNHLPSHIINRGDVID